jgi:hypothetical protein
MGTLVGKLRNRKHKKKRPRGAALHWEGGSVAAVPVPGAGGAGAVLLPFAQVLHRAFRALATMTFDLGLLLLLAAFPDLPFGLAGRGLFVLLRHLNAFA